MSGHKGTTFLPVGEEVLELALGARKVHRCGLCVGTNLDPVLSLGSSPPTCVMHRIGHRPASEQHHPLELVRCADCTLVQLSVIVAQDVAFPPDYPYQSGNSKALHDDFEQLAQRVAARWEEGFGPGDLVVDIGANDGTLLSKFEGCRTVGVEPTGQAERIQGPSYQAFFDSELAHQILVEHGPAKVITACNVLAHVEDIDEVMRGIDILLDDDGALVAENHDLGSVVDGGQWDTVYHEHLRFYSPHSFHRLLERYGFAGRAWEDIPTHGGSFRVVAQRGKNGCAPPDRRDYDFGTLGRSAAAARDDLRKAIPPGCCGIGATARATTIINYCGLDVEDIRCVYEVAGSDKIGHYIPGTRIPVVEEDGLLTDQPPTVLFSWHLADRIVPKLRKQGYRGDIIVPLPILRHV